MRVIILNGSPKAHGNTATALHEVERTAPGEVVRDEEGMQTMRHVRNLSDFDALLKPEVSAYCLQRYEIEMRKDAFISKSSCFSCNFSLILQR